MSVLAAIFGGGGDAVAKPVEAVGNVLDKLFTSDDERLSRAEARERLAQRPAELQVQLNMLEAQHSSVFVAGWRPHIGWVCGIALFMFFVPQYAAASVVWIVAIHEGGWADVPPYPVTPDALLELVLAMLGMASLRTAEKRMGVAR